MTAADTEHIERFLRVRGWNKAMIPLIGHSELAYYSKNGDWRIELLEDGGLELQRFTDSDVQVQDVGAVATPRFVTEAESDDWKEMHAEMIAVGALEWECPNCGETGGSPRSESWREFQGCSEHGGTVEFSEEGCSKCMRKSGHADIEDYYDYADDAGAADREVA